MSERTEASTDFDFLADAVDPDRIHFETGRREQYAIDASEHEPSPPDVVVTPITTDEISAILAGANQRGIPVTPWTAGSSLEGNSIPVEGGILLDLSGMTRIEAYPEDLRVVVEPGVVYDDLNEHLAPHGLRFPPGISSGDVAAIGGMIANNASGFNAVRYGATRDHVRRLEVVLADGRVIQCGRDVVKTAAGYSLKDLFVGSEGTLGVITEATLAVAGIPQHRRVALVTFPTREDASRTVAEIIRYGVVPGAIEFLDELTVEIVDDYSDLGLEVAPTLLIEFHGNNSGIEEDVAFVESICADNDATGWEAADDEASDLWQARRDALPAFRAYRGDRDVAVHGDVVVPISQYPTIVERVRELSEVYDLVVPSFGHAGDGNLHFDPLVPTDDDAAHRRALEFADRVIEAAIDLGGSATGEHGVGIGKRRHMRHEHGAALDVMRTIKETLDPNGILNPGKVLPEE